MALFVIIPTAPESAALDGVVKEKFGNKCLQLPRGEWLVSYDGTSQQLSNDLQITEGQVGVSAIILNFTSYYGRAGKNIWEWISVNGAP